jgi:Putative transposase of IS4/5 family (DUF4096)
MREIINGIFYVMRAGCRWRLLPNDLPPWADDLPWFATSTTPHGKADGDSFGRSLSGAKFTVYDKTQGAQNVQHYLCGVFDMKLDDVHEYWRRLDHRDHADKQNAGAHESGLVVVLRDEGRLLAADRS